MRSPRAISADYLERISDPSSPFHSDYLEYTSGRIDRRELVARLPHIAMIGDSLSRNVYVSSPLSTFWRARRHYGNDWFINLDPSSNGIFSIFERLNKLTPLVATEYGGLGALVDNEKDRELFFRRILRTRNLSGQVTQVLSAHRFPNLILVWIGHNSVDWALGAPEHELNAPENRLRRLSKEIRENYTRQMRRLIARACAERHRVAIIVYGLIDFEGFFKARATAESLRQKNPKLYPHLGVDYRYHVSMRPAYRANLIRLVQMVNEGLHDMAGELQCELGEMTNVQMRYSDALAKADCTRVEVIHAIDGWHPSVEGHKGFAEAAFPSLEPSLRFLGIASD